jgi:hypothetical protein
VQNSCWRFGKLKDFWVLGNASGLCGSPNPVCQAWRINFRSYEKLNLLGGILDIGLLGLDGLGRLPVECLGFFCCGLCNNPLKNVCGLLGLKVGALPRRVGRWEVGGLGLRCFIFRFDGSLLFVILFGRSARCFLLGVTYVWG